MSTSRYGSTRNRRKMRTISRGMPGGPVCKVKRRIGPACSAGSSMAAILSVAWPLDGGDLFGCEAALQGGPAVGGAKNAPPIDSAVRRNEIAVVAVGKHD